MSAALIVTAQNSPPDATDSQDSAPGELPNVPIPTQQDGTQGLMSRNDIYAMLPGFATKLENTATTNTTVQPTNTSIPQPNKTTEITSSSARMRPVHAMIICILAAVETLL